MQPQTLKFFQLHNPFYMLSALCMLGGCYGVVQSMEVTTGHTETLLLLMSVLQVYELLLVGLAWFLIQSRRAERDGRMLLIIEIVFLVDTTYLNAEYLAAAADSAALVSLVALALVFVKVAVMLQALEISFSLKIQAFVLTHFGVLLGAPVLAAKMSQANQLSDPFFYGLWWMVGLLPLAQVWMVDGLQRRLLPKNWLRPIERTFRIALTLVPYLSILWHIGTLHWVYDFPIYACYGTPVVLGLGFGLSLVGSRWFSPRRWTRILWTTSAAALAFSAIYPSTLLVPLDLGLERAVLFSPLRLALLALALAYFASFFLYRARLFLPATLAVLGMAAAGHSVPSILDNARRFASAFVPETAMEWCLVCIVGAFVFLALGAAVSLTERHEPRAFNSD